MIGRGILGDTPPNSIQPPLVDGVHLRWAFKRELGFPWHGFYLFRRHHRRADEQCLSGVLRGTRSGPWPSRSMSTPRALVSSDQPLLLTDDFPPGGVAEFDLRDRSHLRFTLPPGEMARAVKVRIGLREDMSPLDATLTCITFEHPATAIFPNPLLHHDASFEVRGDDGQLLPQTQFQTVDTTEGPLAALACGYELVITLPVPSSFVVLKLTHESVPASIGVINADGVMFDKVEMQNPQHVPERIEFKGENISRLIIHAPYDETFLHEICFGSGERARTDDKQITVKAFWEQVQVDEAGVTGLAGQIIEATLEYNAITAVEVSPGPAAVVDICFEPVAQDATEGWEQVPGFKYPMCLPLTHPDYPCGGGGSPVDRAAAEALALGRVRYGNAGDWAGAPFTDLHETLLQLVVGGPAAKPMAGRTLNPITAVPVPPDPGVAPPHMTDQYPLDMVLLAALNPALAQMVGLYWADHDAAPGVPYDYLIVADYKGVSGPDPQEMLSIIGKDKFKDVEGFIVFDVKTEPAPPLPAVQDIKAYALPGSTVRAQGGGLLNANNNAGLRWQLAQSNLGMLQPDQPIMYHVWRADLGDADTPGTPSPFKPLTADRPVVVVEPKLPAGQQPQRFTDWPPFPLHYIDDNLAGGWYAYKTSGVDIFGRHSEESKEAGWYEWGPAPEPRPWYYKEPAGDTLVHPSAVRLLDKNPPPPPTGVEAYALDPYDPTLLKDATYNNWLAQLTSDEKKKVIGLRVMWQWTNRQMRQAPNTREFRIYYQPAHFNAQFGRVQAVSSVSDTESLVLTDIAHTRAADAYAGARLRIGPDSFHITGSEAGTPLRLKVRNLGPTYNTGTISVAKGSATVTGLGTNWTAGLTELSLQVAGETAVYSVLKVDSPTQLTLDRIYAEQTNAGKSYILFDLRPRAGATCAIALPEIYSAGNLKTTTGTTHVLGTNTDWRSNLSGMTLKIEGDLTTYRIASVDSPTELTLDRNYAGPTSAGKSYAIRHPLFTDYTDTRNWKERYYVVDYNKHFTTTTVDGQTARRYEVLLPASGDSYRGGLALSPSLVEPIVYAQIGVSAADDQKHTDDAPQWAAGRWGNRYGNEGRVGPPATVFRILREPPPPPVPPPDAERVFATPANYNSESFYTYRWRPSPHLGAHIFRALDDTIFRTDWAARPRTKLEATHLQFFPDETVESRWNQAKRGQVASELNQLNAFTHDAAGTEQALDYYRKLSNDALRVLATLQGNEDAFTQLTIQPLSPDDPANADRRGPDSPDNYKPDANLRAFVDTLDGRSTNRYFYRSAYVDAANNRSPLSLSSPPVWLPNVVPPVAPVLTKVFGGDRQITIGWASNREPDLASYSVYRADNEEDARDLRLMKLMHTEAAGGDPSKRPAEVIWTDKNVAATTTLYYRVVAADDAGNVSQPSQVADGRAYDYGPPVEPTWERSVWVKLDANGKEHAWSDTTAGLAPAVALVFTTPQKNVSGLVQRQNGAWRGVAPWVSTPEYDAGAGLSRFRFYDRTARTDQAQTYRARLMTSAGVNLDSRIERVVAKP